MEPGHEDREYPYSRQMPSIHSAGPQWSPVMKTGNTRVTAARNSGPKRASMEPGHEDREYRPLQITMPERSTPQWSPVMKTGNTGTTGALLLPASGLNGARS